MKLQRRHRQHRMAVQPIHPNFRAKILCPKIGGYNFILKIGHTKIMPIQYMLELRLSCLFVRILSKIQIAWHVFRFDIVLYKSQYIWMLWHAFGQVEGCNYFYIFIASSLHTARMAVQSAKIKFRRKLHLSTVTLKMYQSFV